MKPQATGGKPFLSSALKPLFPLDPGNAEAQWADFLHNADEKELDLRQRFAAAPERGKSAGKFLAAVLDLSPYLRDVLLRRPAIVAPLADASLAERLQQLVDEIEAIWQAEEITEARLMTALRLLKQEVHVLVALGDLSGIFSTQETTLWLSRLAEAAVGAAIRFLLSDAHAAGKLKLPDPAHPDRDSGWIVLAMGKFGAFELNYSSDIDLIMFIDERSPAIDDPYECVDVFSRLTRRLVRILQDRTADGYVFRTDLRLRPDPGSTPLAIPVSAALNYYEGRGQNWERAAMIKARPVAGDIAAGKQFLAELAPYVWRKYLDYAAIADVHSIKRQIHAHKGHGEIAVRGHNVKLGRGGIREIEFFVQTQQLIAGGRFPQLRGSGTVAMLGELQGLGWINEEARDTLSKCYFYLRDVEHRIQMIADEQTHTLPEDDEAFLRVAHMMGYGDGETFAADFRETLKQVEIHYAALFEQAQDLAGEAGNLVFTGDVDDPDTLQTLTNFGFKRPSDICRVIRTWHFGRYRATQSAESRERLTELTPVLLKAFGATSQADEALMRFDEMIKGLPAGIQLFSLLQSNPRLLDLLVLIMGAAPRLADIITRKPHIFDGMLDPAIFSSIPTRAYLAERLESFLGPSRVYEDILDRLRIFAAEHRFLIGIRLLTGAIDGARAGKAFSDLADLVIDSALQAVIAEFVSKHGRISGGRIAILGMGKLGSRELTAGSDVDLILLYDHDPEAEESDGDKPLAPSQYHMRLTQRLIAALSAPTAEGVLYEVDFRLRPSGNKGPVATHIEAFRKYQRSEAWTWEHMALSRGRPVAGDAEFAGEIETDVAEILALPRDPAKIAKDVLEMRDLLEKEKAPRDGWDLKLIAGGIIDLEFIAQFAVLTGATSGSVTAQSTAEVLARIDSSLADAATVSELVEAAGLYTSITQLIRLCLNGDVRREDFPPGLEELLCRACDLPDLARVEAHITETSQRVRRLFDLLLKKSRKSAKAR
ncbi:bifunctional [glutamine synthetase] adenylyltransferase/[glutamine synthetase]-adenylyl-L-tyrosine phosphorylase [Phyllobacterium sp. 21LDTY02-6]|uniref:bifunctional [glutamine synthetase] adenylyltransferase/[glutamine synthetase]-adenylyl-L-tyrosine phosphorylase n=1 Tax=Phyllobacterium sp. 21LDTY02-6 TaxID=2944903 RepID=UPI00202217FF|nr:bifunctional [glutamine synthetase] adenylyltransferase/[glutamine synthetase]-adenylyl-L-tyrosine phosphorylase [Phyllobacterium sp. 21LDTY02-6]MCO4319868.1 bifunctional [glutamine synthetase] adenylyltransferase/[glutamine synthetase]-adenylyl-L-tyrosine phosphorylase [Phyllobacterium sp. 21LDTY02-6]